MRRCLARSFRSWPRHRIGSRASPSLEQTDLPVELSPRGFVPQGRFNVHGFHSGCYRQKNISGSTTAIIFKTQTIDYHWNQKGTYNTFKIADHTTVGTAGRVAYKAAKYLKWGGRVLLVVGNCVRRVVDRSVIKASPPDSQGCHRMGGRLGWL